ncbi:MAG TPA: hypothetical protein VGB52_08065 [Actinomycetota bacterium]
MELSPQARRWTRRIAKGSAIAIGVYVAVQVAFIAFVFAAFAFGGGIA